MDHKELVEWVKTNDLVGALRSHINNVIIDQEAFEPFADLVTKGECTIKIKFPDARAGSRRLTIQGVTQPEAITQPLEEKPLEAKPEVTEQPVEAEPETAEAEPKLLRPRKVKK